MTPALTLAGFLGTFLVRRVLRHGVLRVPAIRALLVAVVVIALGGALTFGVVTLRSIITDPELLRPLLRVAGTAVPMWTLALFTVVRVLFLRSNDLVELTYCLPVTNRARTIGFMLFEAALVGAGTAVILGALVVGALSIGGIGILDDIVTCLVMPSVISYLLASALYLALERGLLRLRLARLRSFLVPVILAGSLIALSVVTTAQSERVLFAAVDRGPEHFAVQLLFADLAETLGPVVATVAWLAIVAVLVALILVVNPRSFEPTRRFAIAPRLFGSSEFGAYVAAHLRPIETMTVYGLVLGGSYALLLLDIELPPFLLVACTVSAVYAHVSTAPLRAIGPRRHGLLVRYLLIVAPQATALVLCAVPIGVMSALTGIDVVTILAVVGFALSNIVVLTLAGIAFPPEKGNPFSVIVGIVTTGIVTGTLLLGTDLLGLPTGVSVVSLLVISAAAVGLSLLGMQKIERTERHEVDVQSTRMRRSGRRRRGGDRDRHAGVADVLVGVD
ncbi:hypothetical protein [Microbacterium sp. GCS4]|uniref:hypothetical protein n=1 Tax=Microbacterium sp. GCS4 TaxID=1692239 RepID=UPI0006809AF4|nr:hypothetical protein [Microbacterium sp. GCS4]KNY05368.1 hypothetical protein AKH00_13530 [Microbacterium sp. GCS4]